MITTSISDAAVGTFTDPHSGGSFVSPYLLWVAFGKLLSLVLYTVQIITFL